MFNPAYEFFVDVAKSGGVACLLSSRTGPDALGSEPSMVQYDAAPLKLYFRSRPASSVGATTAEQLAAGSLVLAGKHVDDLGAVTLLFSCVAFVVAGDGDTLHYLGNLSLTDPAIATKMAAANTLSVRIDIEWTSGDGLQRVTWQFDAVIRRQVYNGEALAIPGTPPTYPAAVIHQLFVPRAEDAARWRFRNGGWECYFLEEDGWRPLVGKLVDGAPAFVPGDLVEE